jgi:hypothetical protein
VRLTLRTLLAYLDDTLEPNEIRQIGQKVAESDAAQELIARIKQITRRRRLTTPPLTGPGAANFDPNTVAEYLDNALSGEQIADVEKLCLESDVHLAEIATCHQILTLVLGEPALVPPTARERMYGLVQGKESIPFRKAAITNAPSVARPLSIADDGDDSPFGPSLLRQSGMPRWVIPVVGVLLVIGLVVTLLKVMPGPPPNQLATANTTGKGEENPPPNATPLSAKPSEGGESAKPERSQPVKTELTGTTPATGSGAQTASDSPGPSRDGSVTSTPNPAAPPEKSGSPVVTTPTGEAPSKPSTEQVGVPSTERRAVGSYKIVPGDGPTLLAQRKTEDGPWVRLTPDSRVYTNDSLVSLPGFLSDVRLDSGLHLQLRGMVPEFATDGLMNLLLESAVVLHANKDVDLDFTLRRGRVYISNRKEQGPAKIRLRFDREIWNITLTEPDSEVFVELLKGYSGDIRWQEGEEPWTGAYLAIIKGKGALDADYRAFPNLEMPGPSFFTWDNKGRGLQGPKKLPRAFPQWDKSPPPNLKEAASALAAMADLSKRMMEKKEVNVVLLEGRSSQQISDRLLAIYSFGALDEVKQLLDVLGDEDPAHGLERITAVSVLQRWLSRGPEMGKRLFDRKERSGLLIDASYTAMEAETILKLLYGYTDAETRSALTYRVLADYLQSKRIAIRELAIRQLIHMGAPIKFNPGWTEPDREKAVAEVNRLVDEQKLPPKAQQGSPQRGPSGPPTGGR